MRKRGEEEKTENKDPTRMDLRWKERKRKKNKEER